ncbi:MAG: hypothetical protein JEY79_00665 [Pseudodesulfovibrio sp.]|nr:hypothetical protein [Pseudodesulfovibrio sp.]
MAKVTLADIEKHAKLPCFKDKNSRPLDTHRKSDHPEVDEAVAHVLSKMNYTPPQQQTYHDAFIRNLKTLVLDLYVAYLQGPDMWIGIARKRANQHTTRFKALQLSGHTIANQVDIFQQLGFVDMVPGYYNMKTQTGKQSRVQATDRLFEILLEYDINDQMLGRKKHDMIILREKDEAGKKTDIDIADHRQAGRPWFDMWQYNSTLATANATLGIDQGEQLRLMKRMHWRPGFRLEMLGTEYRRIFNRFNGEDFLYGGRLYGHWCLNIPSELREDIYINGEKTVERDFKALHPSMAYDLAGKNMPDGDLYTWPNCKFGEKERKIRKILFNTLLNADTPDKAFGGAYGCLQDKHEIDVSWGYIKSLYEPLVKHHSPIAEFFGSGLGRKLQFIDSEIAMGVLLDLASEGIVALPVHDSFIVQERHEDRLVELMKCHYRGRMGSTPEID